VPEFRAIVAIDPGPEPRLILYENKPESGDSSRPKKNRTQNNKRCFLVID
jgi:hypothetical protein